MLFVNLLEFAYSSTEACSMCSLKTYCFIMTCHVSCTLILFLHYSPDITHIFRKNYTHKRLCCQRDVTEEPSTVKTAREGCWFADCKTQPDAVRHPGIFGTPQDTVKTCSMYFMH